MGRPLNEILTCAIELLRHAHKHTGLENEGFRGIGLKKDNTYRFSVWARTVQQNKPEKIRIEQ